MHISSKLYSLTFEKNSRQSPQSLQSRESFSSSKEQRRRSAERRGGAAREAEKPHQSTSRSGQSPLLLERCVRIGPTYGCRKASLTLKRENEYYLPQRPEVSLQVYFFKEIYRHGKKCVLSVTLSRVVVWACSRNQDSIFLTTARFLFC